MRVGKWSASKLSEQQSYSCLQDILHINMHFPQIQPSYHFSEHSAVTEVHVSAICIFSSGNVFCSTTVVANLI